MNKLFILAVLCAGCGGSDFSAAPLFGAGGNGSGGETQEATGGQATTSTGGDDAGVVGTGGNSGSTGGTPGDDSGATGGAAGSGSGGETSVGTGGAPNGTGGSTGGSAATGGVTGTGGAAATGGVTSTGGSTGCTIVHDNGLGQTWQDCVPLGTYDQTQAMKACVASGAGLCIPKGNVCTVAQYEKVLGYDSSGATLIGQWGFWGYIAGYVSSGTGICSDPGGRWN